MGILCVDSFGCGPQLIMANIRGRYAIVGIGETEVGRRSEKSGTALGLEAAAAAI